MSRFRSGTGVLLWLLAPVLAGSAMAQVAPRLTGSGIVEQLDTVQRELSARAASLPRSRLADTSQQLGSLSEALRKSLGSDAGKPVDIIAVDVKAAAYRAFAAAQRTRAYLDASQGCPDADAGAMADALAHTVELLAADRGASKVQPFVTGVETKDQRSLFVLRGAAGSAFALVGTNLLDAQCEDPQVTAMDMQGRLQAVQPRVTGVSPARIELELPEGSQLALGGYVLHVTSRRKAFMMGCTAQPPTVAVVQVAAPEKVSVSYAVTATCDSGQVTPAVTGTMPEFIGAAAVSQGIAADGCANPVSYAVTAKVTFSDGRSASVGPISQSASAGITAGLPGGLSLSWDPMVRQLFVRPSTSVCKGVY